MKLYWGRINPLITVVRGRVVVDISGTSALVVAGRVVVDISGTSALVGVARVVVDILGISVLVVAGLGVVTSGVNEVGPTSFKSEKISLEESSSVSNPSTRSVITSFDDSISSGKVIPSPWVVP